MNKKGYRLIAAIDIGSYYIRMSIAQASDDGKLYLLEDLTKPTNIGKDAFSTGRISLRTIHDTTETLNGFVQLMRDYKVKDYKAISTTGIREAENQEYILEQIRLRTGLEVEVINNAQERFLMYKALRNQMAQSQIFGEKATLIVNITSGGVEVSIYEMGALLFTEYVKLGSLRLREILSELERKTMDFSAIMEEYIDSKIYFLKTALKSIKIKNFIALGGQLSTIYPLCYGQEHEEGTQIYIEKKKIENLYKELSNMGETNIASTYKISKKEEEILLPSVIFFNIFLRISKLDGFYAPMTSLRQGMLYHMCDEIFDTERKKESINDIISSVWYIAKKYGVSKKHAAYVEQHALSIFDQTKKVHKLNERERLYLQVAAILHDTGNFLGYTEHDIHSFNIIKTQNIVGFSSEELNIIANIAKYHTNEIPNYANESYSQLSFKKKIVVSKLAAILRLAESLDVSHKQKITAVHITKSTDQLFFVFDTKEDTLLEEWDFINNAQLFEEVMGVEPIIKGRG